MDPAGTHLTLTIVPGSDPIAGRIRFDDGGELDFFGYVQLVGVLERIREGEAPLDAPSVPERRPEL